MDEITIGFQPVVEEICCLDWEQFTQDEMTAVAWAYYFFSIQFRECLEVALSLHPDDQQLRRLDREECSTANLSPWPGVAEANEAMNHDEFMRRTLTLSPISPAVQSKLRDAGERYLTTTRAMDGYYKAMTIASYECGGLEAVFSAMLRAKHWDTPLLASFRHFLKKHIAFDSDPEEGHGALIQHFLPDARIRPMWVAFRDLLLVAVPNQASFH